jgi:hypothetical protein
MGKQPAIQDDITIVLQTQKIVVHETVRINVAIQAQVHPDQSETEFRKQVHSTLRQFIKGDWKIQSIQRQKGNQFEGVTVRATVRVSEKEDHQLESRAAKVSKIGFELVSPNSEYELTFDEIQAVNAELRLSLVNQALAECSKYNAAFKDAGYGSLKYRISSTRFDNGNVMNAGNRQNFNMMIAASANATMASSNQYQPEMMEDLGLEEAAEEGSTDMGVSTRFSMIGTFVLRSVWV